MATLQVSYRRERHAVRPIRADGRIVSRPTGGERLFGWVRAPILSVLGRLTARLSDAVVAPSRVTARELEEDYGANVMAVIPNGVTELDADRQAAPDLPELPRPLVLYAGRLRTRKAVAVLVEAFAQVASRNDQASLAIAGDGEHRDALEERVRELGLGNRIRFLGAIPRQDLLGWYDHADLFCLPSIYEGFPLVILEAMAAGLPVVSTTVSGIPEAVRDGESGYLVPEEDATALAEALLRLLEDPERRREMGARARRAVEEQFSIAVVTAAYMDLWRRCLGEGDRR